MRCVLLCACALLWPAMLRAERIQILGVVANFVTARDAVDFEVWMDRPLDMSREWLDIQGGNGNNNSVIFNAKNREGIVPRDFFVLTTGRYLQGSLIDVQATSHIPVDVRQRQRNDVPSTVYSFSFSTAEIRFDDFTPDAAGEDRFVFQVAAHYVHNGYGGYDKVDGWSTIDDPQLIRTPEPSSFALAGIGVVALLVHLIRRPGFRVRSAERHVSGEPRREGVA